jgi:hypothetical protein
MPSACSVHMSSYVLTRSLHPPLCAQPAEVPSLDTGVVATNVLPSGGPSVLGLDDAVTALSEAIDWERLRQLALPGQHRCMCTLACCAAASSWPPGCCGV